jgi:VanZ like protein
MSREIGNPNDGPDRLVPGKPGKPGAARPPRAGRSERPGQTGQRGHEGQARQTEPRPHAFFWRYTVPLLCYLSLIVFLSHQEASSLPSGLPHDKILHTVEYIPVGVLLLRWWVVRRGAAFSWPAVAVVVVSGIVFAVSDELHQSFVPGRQCDLFDVVADTGGVTAGVLLYAGWCRVRSSRF